MKRFNSRYERIRHLRSQQEDACRAAAAARNAERAAAQQQCDDVQNWLEKIHRTAAQDMAKSLSGGVFVSMTSMMQHGEEKRQAAADELQTAEENLKLALQHHSAARAELKIIEEVIHREHTEHRRAELKREEVQMQEQASQAYYRMQGIRSES
jgi:flagellar biosynthesis chaperone FliJ